MMTMLRGKMLRLLLLGAELLRLLFVVVMMMMLLLLLLMLMRMVANHDYTQEYKHQQAGTRDSHVGGI